jgi:hypothetical protein
MSETAEPRNKAQDTVAMTAATMGHDIVAALLNELRKQPGQWSTLDATYQQKTIDEFKEKVSGMVRKCLGFMLTSDFQAVPAKLENVSRRKSIKAQLTIASNSMYRHALFDAEGQHVLVVLADPAQWLGRMDEIKARGNQLDLFNPDANYDSERDQPGYRRDRDPLAPGKSWDELKKSIGLGGATEPPADATKGASGETKAPDPATNQASGATAATGGDIPTGESLTKEQEAAAILAELQARLAKVGNVVSLGTLQSRSDADILAATLWLNWYEADDIKTPYLERPAWLPEPPNNPNNGSGK